MAEGRMMVAVVTLLVRGKGKDGWVRLLWERVREVMGRREGGSSVCLVLDLWPVAGLELGLSRRRVSVGLGAGTRNWALPGPRRLA